MSRLAVTAADLDRADRLLARIAENDRKEVAKLLAEIREEALLCAMVRAERTFEKAKQPGLPFDAPPTRVVPTEGK